MSQLAQAGKPNPNDRYERLYKTLRDTAFVELGGAFTDTTLFTATYKDEKYKTPGFPSQSQAYKIIGIRVTPLVMFDTGASDVDGPAQASKMAAFTEFSKFSLKYEGNDVFNEYLSTFCNFDTIPAMPEAAGDAMFAARSKFNNFFKLPIPVTIAAGSTFEFKFSPIKNYTTEATNAADLTFPDAGLTGDNGYGVVFDLITTNVKERG